MNIFTELMGWIATILTIAMYAPQTIKAVRTKKTEGLSKATFCLAAFGSAAWTIFGVSIHSWQAWSANAVILLLMIPLFFYLFKDNLKIFIGATIILIAAILVTLILMIIGRFSNTPLSIIASIMGGIGTGIPFVPQTFKTFKTHNISSIAIMSTWAVIFANAFWVLYYLGRLIEGGFAAGDLIALLLSALGSVTASIMAYVYYKYKNKK